jgi:hypothetical protein
MIYYEWDVQKAEANFQKHGISFADAVHVFEDEYALTIEDENPGEIRYIILGMDARGRLLVVVYTYRRETIRIISARKASRSESDEYERDKK